MRDHFFMKRAIQLAKNGLGTTAPNPMVGAVLVHNDQIIGEGFTSAFGGPHAEINAIHAVSDKSLLKEATLYVTLEPCCHHGKTPPCVEAIIEHHIKKVVIGLLDPHEKVAGKGIEKLKAAGCEVTVGVLEAECREHHKRFLTFHEKKRPYIILKWAQTEDGFIAPEQEFRADTAEPYWITSTLSRQLVHQWRAEEQSILIGTNTALIDNPKLDVRHFEGKNPVRVILDRRLKIQQPYHVLDGSIKTIIITENTHQEKYQKQCTYEVINFDHELVQNICKVLHKHNVTSVLIEGGTKTLQTFIDSNLWDEARVFIGNSKFKKGLAAPTLNRPLFSKTRIQEDKLQIFYK